LNVSELRLGGSHRGIADWIKQEKEQRRLMQHIAGVG